MKNKGGSGCTKAKPCNNCEGDCDVDADCKSGLKQANLPRPQPRACYGAK